MVGSKKICPSFCFETRLWKKGIDCVIGIDEVGRGAFAGPLVVGAVCFPPYFAKTISVKNSRFQILSEVNDSKLLSPNKREMLARHIQQSALASVVVEISVKIINQHGINRANQIGFRKAVARILQKVSPQRAFLLVDGFHARYIKGIGLGNQQAIIKGDQKVFSIAAASIIAKVHRDSIMLKLHKQYPKYNFRLHKGYGTKLHRQCIQKYGLSEIHRPIFCQQCLSA
jgi:ribonuclease HII